MIFFSGLGILTPLFGSVGMIIAVIVATDMQPGVDNMPIGVFVGGLAAAILCWWCGSSLNNPERDRIVIDKRTGQEIRLKKRHTLMFIPMQWWSIAYIAIAFFGLTMDKPAQSAQRDIVQASPVSVARQSATVNTIKLNLRNGPGPDYDVIATMGQGLRVKIIRQADNGWIEIEVPGQDGAVFHGFASAQYIATE
jgi:hypothetical protein